MPLERKPVDEQDDPGYPSANEYATGRRAFLGLLGLTALGVGGAYVLKKRATAASQRMGGTPPPPRGGIVRPVTGPMGDVALVVPQTPTPDKPAPVQPPAQPQARPEGEAISVKLPQAQPQTAPQAPIAQPVAPQANLKGDVAPVQPAAQIRGRIRTVQPLPEPEDQPPAEPQGATGGKPKPPAKPRARLLGARATSP
jgi:hypothetical protein